MYIGPGIAYFLWLGLVQLLLGLGIRQGQIQEFALGGPLTLPHSPSPFPLPQSGVLENF